MDISNRFLFEGAKKLFPQWGESFLARSHLTEGQAIEHSRRMAQA
jgi:hypothetical protein